MNNTKVKAIVEAKKERLIKIQNGAWWMALTKESSDGCFRRRNNAEKFLEELKEVFQILYLDVDFRMVTLKKFETSVQEADDVTDYFNGTFCKIANVHSFGKDSVWVIYLKPDKEL